MPEPLGDILYGVALTALLLLCGWAIIAAIYGAFRR